MQKLKQIYEGKAKKVYETDDPEFYIVDYKDDATAFNGLKKGTIVDSTFIESPSSTKNREKKRDPEAHSAKKGNTWHFGYKAHIGVDEESGLVHTVKATPANEHDVTVMSELLHEEERAYGDSGYIGANKRPEAIKKNKNGKKIKYLINRRPSSIKKLSKSGQYAAKKKEH